MLSSYWHEGNCLEAARRRRRRGEDKGEEERKRKGKEKKKKGHSGRTISAGLNEKIRALLWKGEVNK